MHTKYAIDKIFALFAIIVLSPFLVIIAVAIRFESPGPILFRQERYGYNRSKFTVLKFRTMTHVVEANEGFQQATRDDPRVTRVGRFLRRSSLDEVPQLVNVLCHSMSIVGPRPHAVEHDEAFAPLIEGYEGRYRVMPGITGLAQVYGHRGPTESVEAMRERIQKDLEYIDRWSIALDLELMLMSAIVVPFQRNAY